MQGLAKINAVDIRPMPVHGITGPFRNNFVNMHVLHRTYPFRNNIATLIVVPCTVVSTCEL